MNRHETRWGLQLTSLSLVALSGAGALMPGATGCAKDLYSPPTATVGRVEITYIQAPDATKFPKVFDRITSFNVSITGADFGTRPISMPATEKSSVFQNVPTGDGRVVTIQGIMDNGQTLVEGTSGAFTVAETDNPVTVQLQLAKALNNDIGNLSQLPVPTCDPVNPNPTHDPRPTLSWGDISKKGAVKYRVEVRQKDDFSDKPGTLANGRRTGADFTTTSGTETSHRLDAPLVDGDYFFRVIPVDAYGLDGRSCPSVSFQLSGRMKDPFADGTIDQSFGAASQTVAVYAPKLDQTVFIGGAQSDAIFTFEPIPFAINMAQTMSYQRAGHSALLLPDGRVFIYGGLGGGGCWFADHPEIYDPLSQSIKQLTSTNTLRAYQTSILMPDGKILVAGGRSGSDCVSPTNEVELVDVLADSIALLQPIAQVRGYHDAIRLDSGKVLIAGGYTVKGASLAAPSVEIYDVTTGTSTEISPMHHGRTAPFLVRTANGKILAIGGARDSLEVEEFDPATSSWSVVGSLSTYRTNGTWALLGDGTILVAGGMDAGGSAVSLIERYDPARNVGWIEKSLWDAPRAGMTSTPLKNGSVLFFGGATQDNSLQANLYQPPTSGQLVDDAFAGSDANESRWKPWKYASPFCAEGGIGLCAQEIDANSEGLRLYTKSEPTANSDVSSANIAYRSDLDIGRDLAIDASVRLTKETTGAAGWVYITDLKGFPTGPGGTNAGAKVFGFDFLDNANRYQTQTISIQLNAAARTANVFVSGKLHPVYRNIRLDQLKSWFLQFQTYSVAPAGFGKAEAEMIIQKVKIY